MVICVRAGGFVRAARYDAKIRDVSVASSSISPNEKVAIVLPGMIKHSNNSLIGALARSVMEMASKAGSSTKNWRGQGIASVSNTFSNVRDLRDGVSDKTLRKLWTSCT